MYLAGPYRAPTPIGVAWNVARAEAAGRAITALGHRVIVPHSLSKPLDPDNRRGDQWWLDMTMDLLERCDAIVTMPDLWQSEGSVAEVARAADLGMQHFTLRDILGEVEWVE